MATKPAHSTATSVASGLTTGTLIAVAFNPLDRALYLSVRERRPFFSAANFRQPFRGMNQAIFHRTLSHGLYYVYQDEFRRMFSRLHDQGHASKRLSQFLVGTCSGILNGLTLNPIANVKYQLWNTEQPSVWHAMRHKWRSGGLAPFFKGAGATSLRDAIFGCVYEVFRAPPAHPAQPDPRPAWRKNMRNVIAGTLGVLLSSPINYARMRIYACPPGARPPSIFSSFRRLYAEARHKTTWTAALRHVQIQLAIGIGTLRSGAGMAAGQYLYNKVPELLGRVLDPRDPHAPAVHVDMRRRH